MKIETIVNLTEAQKARIVSRNEPFPQRICTFEMSPEKAEIISRLKGTYKLESSLDGVVIQATDEKYSSDSLQVEETRSFIDLNWRVVQETIRLKDVLAEAYAAGTITPGANIDFVLDIMAEALQRRDDILENNKIVEAEKARKEEEERPAREAQKKREAEEQAAREKEQKAKEAAEAAEDRARNEAIEAEKKAWIEQNGSERLKKGYAGGYRCQKLYEIERAQSVLGSEYVRDSKEIDEKDRSCPSLEALQEVERIQALEIPVTSSQKRAVVVWLPHGIDDEDESGCEAVKADPGKFSQHYFYRVFLE